MEVYCKTFPKINEVYCKTVRFPKTNWTSALVSSLTGLLTEMYMYSHPHENN